MAKRQGSYRKFVHTGRFAYGWCNRSFIFKGSSKAHWTAHWKTIVPVSRFYLEKAVCCCVTSRRQTPVRKSPSSSSPFRSDAVYRSLSACWCVHYRKPIGLPVLPSVTVRVFYLGILLVSHPYRALVRASQPITSL